MDSLIEYMLTLKTKKQITAYTKNHLKHFFLNQN